MNEVGLPAKNTMDPKFGGDRERGIQTVRLSGSRWARSRC
jgi:hypothetical protein